MSNTQISVDHIAEGVLVKKDEMPYMLMPQHLIDSNPRFAWNEISSSIKEANKLKEASDAGS